MLYPSVLVNKSEHGKFTSWDEWFTLIRRLHDTLNILFILFCLFHLFLCISVQLTLANNFRVVYCTVLSFLMFYPLCFLGWGEVNEFGKYGQTLPLVAFHPILLWVGLDCSKNGFYDSCIHLPYHTYTISHDSKEINITWIFQDSNLLQVNMHTDWDLE